MKEVNLKKFLNPQENVLAGREQGEKARKIEDLDNLDKDKNINQIIFIIPNSLIAITPSFYLGFLFKSYKRLKEEGFLNRYSFKIETPEAALRHRILEDLEEGRRASVDSLDSRGFLDKLI